MTPTPLTDAVKVDRRTELVALRDQLAAAIREPDRPPHTTAPLARQLQAVLRLQAALREIAELPDPDAPPSKLDELQQRVAARRNTQRSAAMAVAARLPGALDANIRWATSRSCRVPAQRVRAAGRRSLRCPRR